MNNSNQIPWISSDMNFPTTNNEVSEISELNGLLAASDRLTTEMLIKAYKKGIFPWSGYGQPILWWSPDPRMVLKCQDFKLHNSLRKKIKTKIKNGIKLTCNKAFKEVMTACSVPRENQKSSWITPEIISSYNTLHEKNLAHSIEVWQDEYLIGGLYTVSIGKMVFGESMFHRKSDASKMALTALVKWLIKNEGHVIDCQQETSHLASLGAKPIKRKNFEELIQTLIRLPELPWLTNPPTTEILL
jgi:leucyl/phenylalanyl-tRNA--protein transferase